MQKLNLHLAINSLSIGQISTLLLKTIYDQEQAGTSKLDITVIPIGNSDLSSQKTDSNFQAWLQSKIIKGLETHSRDIPTFKCWHLNQSLESVSDKQTLLSFYELDSPTKVELNIAKNQHKLCFSSQYTCDVFKMFGVNSRYLPLAFDSYNFKKLDKKFHTDDRIVFGVNGKAELRKSHPQIIKSWIKKYGNNPKYFLQCAIYNPFLTPEQNQQTIGQILGVEKPFNVGFYPMMKENSIYNDFLNSCDIVLGMGKGEGWDLPAFQSVAMGKHAVILNANAYKGWANEENSVLINPSGKEAAVDNVFFRKGQMFNQGNWFLWNEDEFINACDMAISRVNLDRVNKNGLLLQEEFNKERFLNSIIDLTLN